MAGAQSCWGSWRLHRPAAGRPNTSCRTPCRSTKRSTCNGRQKRPSFRYCHALQDNATSASACMSIKPVSGWPCWHAVVLPFSGEGHCMRVPLLLLDKCQIVVRKCPKMRIDSPADKQEKLCLYGEQHSHHILQGNSQSLLLSMACKICMQKLCCWHAFKVVAVNGAG